MTQFNPAVHCGGKKTDGTPCTQVKGWGTDHAGEGKCKLHGGASLRGEASPTFKHGRYSAFLKADMAAKLEAVETDGDPLDLLPELSLQRALVSKFVDRYHEGYTMTAFDVDYMMSWLAEIGRTVERIVKMRNATALTAAEIALIASRLPEIVARFIPDAEKQNAFLDALFSGLGYAGESEPTYLTDGEDA